jgi:predicted RecB family nuclease
MFRGRGGRSAAHWKAPVRHPCYPRRNRFDEPSCFAHPGDRMRLHGTELSLSATDLSNFLGCRHRTALDMAVAYGRRSDSFLPDPLYQVLIDRGIEHERAYVHSLREAGHEVLDFGEVKDPDEHVVLTLQAMRDRTEFVVQGALRRGRWFGKPDVLLRVAKPSALGDWSYEVLDTKLARETRGGTILQLGLYSQMLAEVQGVHPEFFYVVTPDRTNPRHSYRLKDYAAYFRLVQRQMLETAERDCDAIAAAHYPEPVEHCEICRWVRDCEEKRRADDHLSLVAGIGRLHRRELESHDASTLTNLARLPLPLGFRPSRGSVETYSRLREQARLQYESRGRTPPLHELRQVQEGEGLCRLPNPSPGDFFLDLEGDPFAAEGGREYLFGLVTIGADGEPHYRSYWGLTEREERRAFEAVMDIILDAWKAHPGMHVYHYAPYEPSAFKRLMGRHATRERELDDILRAERFVDLYAVVRQAMLIGTERYSIKNLEPLYGYGREVKLEDANRYLRVVEHALELGHAEMVPADVRDAVQGYNRDDCISTLRLRDWLEQVRADHERERGQPIPRPSTPEVERNELDERATRVEALRARLLKGVPEVRAERTAEEQARYVLAYMLDYHRREDKAVWWEYFRLRDLPDEELLDEPQAIAGLEFVERVSVKTNKRTGKPTGSVVDRYRFPPQEVEIEPGGKLHTNDDRTLGEVAAVDRECCTIDIAKGPSRAADHPPCVFEHTHVNAAAMEESLARVASLVAGEGAVRAESFVPHRAARSLLLAEPPRLASGDFRQREREETLEFLRRSVLALDESVLAVQGPPGSGKTYCGAEMVLALVAEGRRVGVTANSHKVIRNFLDAVARAAVRDGVTIRFGHKIGDESHAAAGVTVTEYGDNEQPFQALATGEVQVLGGTAWMWSREEFAGTVDVLFVDEAGQMSLANAVAVAPAGRNLVLLGDPQQLEQPRKGTHPEGVCTSALQHMLGDSVATIPVERGVFLDTTWRLCPAIASFTSELFYEGRLTAKAGLECQRLDGAGDLDGSGLAMISAEHDGNRTFSDEEAAIVRELVDRLTSSGATWTDSSRRQRPLAGSDILVVAPYNAHVSRLVEQLEATGARVGTVDKFQGQEAPVVIYSMATSRPEDAPRGMEFLYSLNRLNVATSRAKCRAIVVASRRLFEPGCRTPRQMRLANALCRYQELAQSSTRSS